jgi:hypothetical protein
MLLWLNNRYPAKLEKVKIFVNLETGELGCGPTIVYKRR